MGCCWMLLLLFVVGTLCVGWSTVVVACSAPRSLAVICSMAGLDWTGGGNAGVQRKFV